MVVKQYLPFSMIEEQAVQDCFIAFAKEHGVVLDSRPKFLGRKTIASDIAVKAQEYAEDLKSLFKSKIALSLDCWTGENKKCGCIILLYKRGF
jgi:phage gp46-like protein